MCDRLPRKFDVQTSYKPSNYVLGLIFVVNIKFPRATYQSHDSAVERRTLLFKGEGHSRNRIFFVLAN